MVKIVHSRDVITPLVQMPNQMSPGCLYKVHIQSVLLLGTTFYVHLLTHHVCTGCYQRTIALPILRVKYLHSSSTEPMLYLINSGYTVLVMEYDMKTIPSIFFSRLYLLLVSSNYEHLTQYSSTVMLNLLHALWHVFCGKKSVYIYTTSMRICG